MDRRDPLRTAGARPLAVAEALMADGDHHGALDASLPKLEQLEGPPFMSPS